MRDSKTTQKEKIDKLNKDNDQILQKKLTIDLSKNIQKFKS